MISCQDFEKICLDGDIESVHSAVKYIELPIYYANNAEQHWNHGLYGACKGGHLNIIKLMIGKGANDWNWGLCGACEGGHLNIIDLIIERGANDWNSGLYGGCEGGHLDIVNLMIQKGANDFDLGLAGACQGGHLNIVNSMIEHGADHWNFGLLNACEAQHSEIIKLMIRNGANDWTPIFDLSSDMIDSDIVDLIIEKNVSIGKFYLEYPGDKIKIFKLLESGLPINNLKDIKGSNDLMDEIGNRQNIVINVLSNHLIDDLIGIVNEYVIN